MMKVKVLKSVISEYLLETDLGIVDGLEEMLFVTSEGFGAVAVFPTGEVWVWPTAVGLPTKINPEGEVT